jgi:hypothetical protein
MRFGIFPAFALICLLVVVPAVSAAPVFPEPIGPQPQTASISQVDSVPQAAAPVDAAPSTERFALGANYYALTYHPGGGGADTRASSTTKRIGSYKLAPKSMETIT